jgi:hypothetical protein
MLPRGFELAIPASAEPQTHTFERAATGIGETNTYVNKIHIFLMLKMTVQTATIVLYRASSCALLPITCSRCVHTAGRKHLSARAGNSIQLHNSAMFADCTSNRCDNTPQHVRFCLHALVTFYDRNPSSSDYFTSSVMLAAL